MSRSGYTDGFCDDNWAIIRWRGMVASSIRGRRGQDFLIELRDALDAMPGKSLVRSEDGELVTEDGEACTIGAVALARGWDDAKEVDSTDHKALAERINVAPCLVQEIEFENDECGAWRETAEERWTRVRSWVEREIKPRDVTEEPRQLEIPG